MRSFTRGLTCCVVGFAVACTGSDDEQRLAADAPIDSVVAPSAPSDVGAAESPAAERDADGLAAARATWPPELVDVVDRAVREFDVPTVSIAGFEALSDDTVLFDVRTAAEASVSGIPNAQLLADEHARQALLDAPPTGPVVVSCAAGWRSARFTQALRAKGVEAYNLEGGIFAWVAAGRTIHDPEGVPTQRVHTYNESWAKCLPADHEVVLEPAP